MNLHLYKVLRYEPDYAIDSVEAVRVMTEKDLRKEFLLAYNNGFIPHELIDDYTKDPDYSSENWDDMENLKIGTVIDMMNDIGNYACGDGYYILETDIEI